MGCRSSSLPEIFSLPSFSVGAEEKAPDDQDEEELIRTDEGHNLYPDSKGRLVDHLDQSSGIVNSPQSGKAEIVRLMGHLRDPSVVIAAWSDGTSSHTGACHGGAQCRWDHEVPTIHRVSLNWTNGSAKPTLDLARVTDFGDVREIWP